MEQNLKIAAVIPNTAKVGVMSADNKPAAFCQDGDTVVFETLDCCDGAVFEDGTRDRTPGKYLKNPATGPLFVEGAMPGDVLKVEILKLDTAPWGFMGHGSRSTVYPGIEVDYDIRIFHVEDGFVKLGGHRFPVNPMIGVIGTAPAGEGIPTMTPDAHGGNMDCTRIREGATLFLPVNVPGALLAMGDLHASMGDGEVFWYGLEISGRVTVRVSVVKNQPLRMPCLVDEEVFAVIASAKTQDEASELAVIQLYDILTANGWDRLDAGLLMSLQCQLRVCQIVDPNMTVRAEMKLELLKPAE